MHGCLRGRKSDLARFHRLKEGQRRQRTLFDKEWATKLPESDKGSFYNKEKLLYELDRDHEASEQAEMSANRQRKIQLQETVKAGEIDDEKWTKLKGRSIVSASLFCQGNVNNMENVLSRNGLGSSWIIRCQNESCLSQSTNSAAVAGNLYLLHVNCHTPIVI